MKTRYITIKQAAYRLGVPYETARSRIRRGNLKIERIGPLFVLTEKEFAKLGNTRKRGRPRKEHTDGNHRTEGTGPQAR